MNAIANMEIGGAIQRTLCAIALAGVMVCGACHQQVCGEYLAELQRLDAMLRANVAEWDELSVVVHSTRHMGVTRIDVQGQSFYVEGLSDGIRAVGVSWQSFSEQSDGTWRSTACDIAFSREKWDDLQDALALLKASGALWLSCDTLSGIGGRTPNFQIHFPVPGRRLGETELLLAWSANGMASNAGKQVTSFTSSQWCNPKVNMDTRWCSVVGNWHLMVMWS